MKELILFFIIVVVTGITYLYYRMSTRRRICEYLNSYGINLKDREILIEVWQFYRFLKKAEIKTITMKKVLFLGLLEISVLLAANIVCIVILIKLFKH